MPKQPVMDKQTETAPAGERAGPATKFGDADPVLHYSDVETVASEGARRFARSLALALGAFVLVLLAWARFSYVDDIARGDALVVSSGRNRIVHAPAAGVVKAIHVKGGDQVPVGQPLMRIDSTGSQASPDVRLVRLYALTARAARLAAEAEGRGGIDFPAEVREHAPSEVEREIAAFRSRARQQESERATFEQQLAGSEQQLRDSQSMLARLEARLRVHRGEEADICRAYRDGSASFAECRTAQSAAIEAAALVDRERRRITGTEAARREARQKIEEISARFRAEARKELVEAEAQMAALRARIRTDGQRAGPTELRSPVRGTVRNVSVAIGSAVKAGDALVEIVPAEGPLLIEVRVKPEDIADVRTDQDATAKIDAYDSAIFGGLECTVSTIGSNAIAEGMRRPSGERESYHPVRVYCPRAYFERGGRILAIVEGMTGRVEIRTGRRPLLDHALEPFRRLLRNTRGGG